MPKILIIEDSPEMRKLARLILEPEGYEVAEAEDGRAGIEAARAVRPDLVLMDLSLPVLNGWDATRLIKSDPELRRLPVIAVTAHAMQGDRERALAAGCDLYLTKPVDDELLLRAVTDLLGRDAAAPASGPAPEPKPRRSIPVGWNAVEAETILIVDDHEQMRQALGVTLREGGYIIEEAGSAAEAIERIRQRAPNLAIIDIMLADRSGYELTEEVKLDPTLPFVPVILISGQSIDREQGLAVGADDFLAKPVESAELLARVGALLRLRRISAVCERQVTELRNLFEQSQTGIVVLDPEGRVTAANGVALHGLGLASEDVLGRPYGEALTRLELSRPDGRRVMPGDEGIAGALDRREVTTNQILTVRTPRGAERVLQLNVGPLLDDHRFHGAVINFQDVTELIRARDLLAEKARELHEANDKLSTLDQLKSRFIATVSHELRTPLNAINILTELLQRDAGVSLSENQKDSIRRLKGNSKFMTRMINDLLDYSRLVAGKQTLQLEPLNPAAAVRDVHDALQETATAKGLDFTCAIDASLPAEVVNDPVKLRQILTNVVGNAIKYTERGRVQVRAAGRGQGQWCVEITDTGVGIPDEEMPYIFDEFRQARHESRPIGSGTGLGLPITRRLVDLMGGEIEVRSEPGAGSTFTVTLPVEARVAEEGHPG